MKLKLEHLAPYLPYGLKLTKEGCETYSFHGLICEDARGATQVFRQAKDGYNWNDYIGEFKPILRPLSDLNISVRLKGEVFNPCTKLYEYSENQAEEDFVEHILHNQKKPSEIKWESCPWYAMVLMFEWHFDVFGLIENNLAIDINTLNK